MGWWWGLALAKPLSPEGAACLAETRRWLETTAACEANPRTVEVDGTAYPVPCPPMGSDVLAAVVCPSLYREPACHAAWSSDFPEARTVVEACARAYCPLLRGRRPDVCSRIDAPSGWDLRALDQAILRFEGLPRGAADALSRRLDPAMEWVLAVEGDGPGDGAGAPVACGEAAGELGFDWVRIEGGRYPVGQPPEGEVAPAALPPAEVQVEVFDLMNVEVPVHQHDACVELGPCEPRPTDAECHRGSTMPANCLSYRDAEALCRFLGGRLPTEIEWEVAARGSEGRVYPWGDAWFDAAFENHDRRVGSCPATDTPDGLHDLGGNVREWTSTASGSEVHVTRSMMCAEFSCMAYNRFPGEFDASRHAYLGVRCARDPGAERAVDEALATPGTDLSDALTVHWSVLGDGVHVDRPGERVVCSVEATIDRDGSTRAGAVVPDPDGAICAPELHDVAVDAVGRSTWPPTDQPVRTVLPVFIGAAPGQ